MGRSLPARSRALLLRLIVAAAVLGSLQASPARAQTRWEVTFALRITESNGKPVTIRLALPSDGPAQRVTGVEPLGRGMKAEIDGSDIVFRGRAKSPRRVAVTYQVEPRRETAATPLFTSRDDLPLAVQDYLDPAPLFPARSILVRDFLETHVGPMLSGQPDVLRAIFAATRQQIDHKPDGKSLVLDVLRRRQAKRIGIERAFTTFLRCARVPARFVEGIRLDSPTRRKRVFWTEAWDEGAWYPASVSRGWIGRLPRTYVELTRDGIRPLRIEGQAKVSYTVQTRQLENGSGQASE